MDPLQKLRELIDELKTKRDAKRTERTQLRDTVEARPEDERDLTDEEDAAYRALSRDIADLSDEITDASDRMLELIETDARDRRANDALRGIAGGTGAPAYVRSEPLTYERHNRQTSYFRDLGMAMVGNDPEARERLAQHRKEMDVELPKLEQRYSEARFERQMEGAIGSRHAESAIVTRDLTRVDGAGGEFVPPIWIMQEYAEFARYGRPFANHIRNIGLPGGTDSISVPRITSGTATDVQTTDNAAVTETDLATNSATGQVRTIAGQQDIALQTLEQSPLMFDEIVFADLTADYNSKLDLQLINGTGSAGQHLGVLQLAGTNSVSYTDATPTVPEFWPTGAQAISQAVGGRKLPITGTFMSPRRWYWMAAALDSSNRPFIVPTAQGPMNSLASVDAAAIAEGPAGVWHGATTILDGNIPTTLGGGTEDAVLTVRGSDLLLFEGALRTRALPEVLSGTLTVRLQVYAYSAFIPGRFPAGISKITGTGLAAPAGF